MPKSRLQLHRPARGKAVLLAVCCPVQQCLSGGRGGGKGRSAACPALQEPELTPCQQFLSCLLQSVLLGTLHAISSQEESLLSIVLLDIMPLTSLYASLCV